MFKSLLVAGAALISLSVSAHAEDIKLGDLVISHAWARESIPTAKAGASYMMIKNTGATDDRLISASSEMAKATELHTHLMQDGVMKMREVEAVLVPAGGQIMFESGSFHVMYRGLHAAFTEGDHFPLQLTFEQAGTVEIMVSIKDIRAGGEMKHGHGSGHKHGSHKHN